MQPAFFFVANNLSLCCDLLRLFMQPAFLVNTIYFVLLCNLSFSLQRFVFLFDVNNLSSCCDLLRLFMQPVFPFDVTCLTLCIKRYIV